MSVPKTNQNVPFNVTRASHAVLTVKDLGRSRAFYVDAIGLVVSDETPDALYLRGTEEAAHHSLVLKRTTGDPVCELVRAARAEQGRDAGALYGHFRRVELPAAVDSLGRPKLLEILCECSGEVRGVHRDHHVLFARPRVVGPVRRTA